MAYCFVPLQSVLCFAGFARRRGEQGTQQCEPILARIACHVGVATHLLSHVVHVATFSFCGRPLHACRSCGVHSARQFGKLLLPCLVVGGVPRPFAWWCCFEQGRHPNGDMSFSKFVRVKLPVVFDPVVVFVLGSVSGVRQVKTKEASRNRSFRPPNASACHLATGAAAAATLRHSVALRPLDDPEGVSESD